MVDKNSENSLSRTFEHEGITFYNPLFAGLRPKSKKTIFLYVDGPRIRPLPLPEELEEALFQQSQELVMEGTEGMMGLHAELPAEHGRGHSN